MHANRFKNLCNKELQMYIIYVEDDPIVYMSLRRVLKRLYPDDEIVLCVRSEEAIKWIQKINDFDGIRFILCDFDLSGIDTGLHVFAYVTGMSDKTLIDRFIFLSGNANAGTFHDKVIAKPIGMAELDAAIEELLRPKKAWTNTKLADPNHPNNRRND